MAHLCEPVMFRHDGEGGCLRGPKADSEKGPENREGYQEDNRYGYSNGFQNGFSANVQLSVRFSRRKLSIVSLAVPFHPQSPHEFWMR
jgi:hypothetical protein